MTPDRDADAEVSLEAGHARGAGGGGQKAGRRGGATARADKAAADDAPKPLVAHGWTLYLHPLLLDQLERLREATLAERRKSGGGAPGASEKLLAHLFDLTLDRIPQDPGSKAFRQDDSLGEGRSHWFRGKTGNGRYRLFYRFDSRAKVIVYAWVNDEKTLREYGAATDAYAVFAGMLDRGDPPNDWAGLLATAKAADEAAAKRRWDTLATTQPRHDVRAD